MLIPFFNDKDPVVKLMNNTSSHDLDKWYPIWIVERTVHKQGLEKKYTQYF